MNWEIVRPLRDSDVAPVHLGRMPDGTEVVVKSMTVGADPATLDRLQKRFAVLAGIEHPGIPGHVSLTIEDGEATWVSEYVPGEVVQSWVDSGRRFEEREIFDFMAEILEILCVLHDEGVVHRDLKPENIVAKPDGSLAVIDFAGANVADGSGNTSVLGTTGFAAPEQLVGDAQFASDQYGLAATALQLATGRHPTEFPLRSLRIELEGAGLSKGLEDTLERMLEPDPSSRFADAATALDAVRDFGQRPRWEWPLTVTNDIDSIVSYEARDDRLKVRIGPRARKGTFVRWGITLCVGVIAIAFGLLATAKTWSVVTVVLGVYLLPTAFFVLFNELRRLSIAELELHGNRWRYTETAPFRRLRREGDTALTATAFQRLMGRGVAVDDTRNSLRLAHGEKSDILAPQLWPVEARAIADAVRQYQFDQRPALPPGVAPTALAPTSTDLGRFETVQDLVAARRVGPIRLIYSLQGTNKPLKDAKCEELLATLPADFVRKVANAGLRYVGGQRERTFFGLLTHKRLKYLSADGHTRLTVGPGGESNSEPGVSYYLMTTLEDGRQILTWSKTRVAVGSSKRCIVTPTAGSLEADLAMHDSLVHSAGSRALIMRNLDDAIAATTWYDRYSTPLHLAILMLVPYAYIVFIVLLFVRIAFRLG